MTPKLLLRIAAAAYGLIFLGHTIGAMVLGPSGAAGEANVLSMLADYEFEVMGFTRSHMDFYVGEGWYLSLTLVTLAVLLLQLASLAEEHRRLVRGLLAPLLVFAIGSTALSAAYFFTAPLAMSVVAMLALFAAWSTLGEPKTGE